MAKLLSYYRLCPLIDTKNLLGISEDAEVGNVIVTLGKNIAIKFRISDQKQLCSWRTKDKFSSRVVFDKKLGKYVAVFNHTFIRLWSEEDESLDKIKKYKFKQQIFTILSHNGETYIVFKTGSVYSLSVVLETRKTLIPAVICDYSPIQDICYISQGSELYFGFLVKQDKNYTFYWTTYTDDSKQIFSKFNFSLENDKLQSYELFISCKTVHFLTVWSNSKIFIKPLNTQDKAQTEPGEVFTTIESISCQHPVKVIPLDESYLAIYGSDPNEEGAVLLIYNTQFKVVQSKQIHKLYSEDAKIWRMFNFILLPVGQNLVVVPFCLESEQLVALIGSHKSIQNKLDSDIAFVTEYELGKWDFKDYRSKKSTKAQYKFDLPGNRIQELFKDGHSEAAVIEQIVPEIMQGCKLNLLEEVLSFFTDIPERFLAQILKCVLGSKEKYFPKKGGGSVNKIAQKILFPNERAIMLDTVLSRKFSSSILLPHLRSTLSLDEAILLLEYITYQLSSEGHKLPSLKIIDSEKCLIKWASLIIDANYQRFILSKDEKIENLLVNCKKVVLETLEAIEGLKEVVPVLRKFQLEQEGQSFVTGELVNCLYSIEVVDY